MKIPTGVLGLIAVLAVIYAASGLFRNYLVSISTGKAPGCLEMLGKTTTEEEGLTFIISSIKNNCGRKYSQVTVVFKMDRMPGPIENLPAFVAYAYSSDVESGETRRFKSALTISRNTTFRLDEINAD